MTVKISSLFSNGNRWLEKQQVSILSAALIITAAVFLSAVTGLLRNRLLVATFFKTPELQQQLEAYWVSFRLPELVFQLLVIGALSAAFIPVFTKYEKESAKDSFRMASSVLNLMLLGFFLFSAIIYLFSEPITRLMTGDGFSQGQILLSAQLTRIMLFAQLFFAISNFLSGVIQSYKRFIIPALSPIAYNLGIILGTLVFAPYLGIYGPTLGVVIGAFFHFIVQLPLAKKLGFRYSLTIDLSLPGVKEIFRLMVPRTLAISINQIQLFATVFFATHLGGYNLTVLTLAQQLMTFPIRIFGAPIGQAALPFLSRESTERDLSKFKKLLLSSLNQIAFFSLPASVLLLILRIPIVRLAYGSREFPWPATLLTGKVVALLAISIAAQAMVHVLVRAFYALHNTRDPLYVSFLSALTFLIISYLSVFVYNWGAVGIGVSLTLSTLLEMILLVFLLQHRLSFVEWKNLIPIFKMVTASFLMAVFLWLPFRALDQLVFDTTRTRDLLGLTVTVSTIGMLTYIFFAVLLNIEELAILKKLLSFMGAWKKSLSQSPEVVETAGQSDESII